MKSERRYNMDINNNKGTPSKRTSTKDNLSSAFPSTSAYDDDISDVDSEPIPDDSPRRDGPGGE